MPDNLFRSHSLEKSSNEGKVVTSGALTIWEDKPVSPLDVGDTFQPVPNGPVLTVKRVNIDDNVIGLNAGRPVRQWQISIEGNDEIDSSALERHTFSIEQDDDNVIHSGSISKAVTSDTPPPSISVGSLIDIPGVGIIKCSKISGSDDFNEYGQRVWHLTYEGTDAPQSSGLDDALNTKYSFTIDNEHSGSMQVVNEGDTPAVTLGIGSQFRIPGIGEVTCSKISGSDDYSQNGIRRWTVTYEGYSGHVDSDTRYSFSCDYSSGVRSGSKQVTYYGNAPDLELHEGDTFSIPCAGSLICTKATGSDEFTTDGKHKWTLSYEGSSESSSEGSSAEDAADVSDTKYSLAIEKNSDGIHTSGSMAVVSTGDVPDLSIAVGDTFLIPGIGQFICSKVSGSDSYSEDGTRKWTMTYEGYYNSSEQGGDGDSLTHAKYTFAFDSSSQSGSLEVSVIGDNPNPDYHVGSKITIPGIENPLTCTKVSGSDSYDDNGQRKWTFVYEVSSNSDGTKYSFSEEKNSDGVTVITGTKQYHPVVYPNGQVEALTTEVEDEFTIPYGNKEKRLKCTKVSGNLDDSGVWTYTIEGQGQGDGDSASSQSHAKYTFAFDSSSQSGSLEVSVIGDNPNPDYHVGSKITIPGIENPLTCTKVSGSDSYDDNGQRKWTFVYEVSSNSDGTKYSFSEEKNSDGVTVITGTKQYHPVVYPNGQVEALTTEVEDEFTIPYGNKEKRLKCTKVSGNLDDSGVWTYTIEGQGTSDTAGSSSDSGDSESGDDSGSGDSDSSLPESEASTSFEINGLTVRTVDGTLVALRRSQSPISRTTITVYNSSKSKLCTPGDAFNASSLSLPEDTDIGVSSDGIVLSENVSKETIKSNNVVIKTYYKHSIEVEA